ncbi:MULTISPECIES: signal recognition particle-docking protein FtsY [Dictyoglomus]|uniref:Signal recognition particle receptor FtsY n=1 Tax=Dictyoglomus turgidum (strain DSM 6724 / Z-1310) TaxID=515635 RepID=B8E1A1_DICTD|nr:MULTISPECIES: signal recognition particle-docking protein FtsY [Dictyoglomus]ACK42229.1 signal recognition particle-docking protein FtsY [Dictyoglomus turgidum DSM 6724]PNV79692.1 MAG: signal recognition particle-docking protein FtsY [Dictyoglomus turgidum]HBU32459.1 signal recognition particle-docking protein FtsY [Dictyoglomus sp.]
MKLSFWDRLPKIKGFAERLQNIFKFSRVDTELLDELEMELIQSDLGIELTNEIIGEIKKRKISDMQELRDFLFDFFKSILDGLDYKLRLYDNRLNVVIFIGVNGTGKTSTVGKFAYYLKNLGYFPIIAAADTFRAAAIDQIKRWGERVGVDVVAQKEGADPGAVVFNAIEAAKARNKDVLLVDTAGRMHTKSNLVEELKKIEKIVEKTLGYPPSENLVVIDATLGQNVVRQVEIFHNAVNLTGAVLTKLDGTAKGGVIFNVIKRFNIPVKLVTIGEELDDLKPFDPNEFVESFIPEVKI